MMAKLSSLGVYLLICWFYEGKQNKLLLILVANWRAEFKNISKQTAIRIEPH